jgi:hypothetical protein
MSNVDTTSFARILLGAMGQGADIFNRASSGAQSIIDSRDNRAFRDRAFAAQESQRAFGNDLALKDQAIQQAAADRSAQQFPLAQRMMQVQSEIQAANLQEMEQQQRTRSTMQQFLAPRVAERIRATSARKYGAPAFKDEMFAYAVANGDVEPQSLTWMMQQLDGERDLDDLRDAAKKHRSLLEGTRRSSAASPEAKAQADALLIMLESENPKVLEKAVMQAAEAQQQQAMQAQRSQLAGMVASGGQLTPEQSLIVMDDPALRRMQEQAGRVVDPAQQAAADEAEAADLIALGMPPEKAMPYVRAKRAGNMTASQAPMGGGVDQTAFLRKQVEDRQAQYNFALDRAKAAGLFRKGGDSAAYPLLDTADVPNDPADPKRQAYAALIQAQRGLERSMADLANAQNAPGSQGLPRSSSNPAAGAKQMVDQVRDALIQRLGRPPTREEMKAALSTQSPQPQ